MMIRSSLIDDDATVHKTYKYQRERKLKEGEDQRYDDAYVYLANGIP